MRDTGTANRVIGAEAMAAARSLSMYLMKSRTDAVRVQAEGVNADEGIVLPRPALELLLELLEQMGEGTAVTIVPVGAELSTRQAADLLNCSRALMSRLIEHGSIPCRRVGNRLRVRCADVLAYRDSLARSH
ncbi:MAG TPA: helix-turn-helix domain-containing protein [Myxococcales bacterium]|jgi:excisionase family DNA binding protein|nr:helix-turn-helix domain-containing protein [Myxococcales bacterium]